MVSLIPQLIVVGSGRSGIRHVTTAHALNALVAVVDKSNSGLSRAKATLPSGNTVRFFPSLTEALPAFPDAAVVITTPVVTRYALATEALGASRHVLVEKPMCNTVDHAAELVRLAEQAGVSLTVNNLLHYNRAHRTLLQLVRSGYVGDVTRVRMTRVHFGPARITENVLWRRTPPDISFLLALCGDALPTSVACVGQKLLSQGIHDYVDMHLRFSGGIQAHIEASWMHPIKERRLVVYGTEGVLTLNELMPGEPPNTLRGLKWAATRNGDGSVVAIEREEQVVMDTWEDNKGEGVVRKGAPLMEKAMEHFFSCIQNRKTPLTDGKEGERVLRILTAATDSLMREGVPTLLSTENDCPRLLVHATAAVDDRSQVGVGTEVQSFSRIMANARLGPSCIIGQNVCIGQNSKLGRKVLVLTNVSISESVTIGDNVFLGSNCILGNIEQPCSHANHERDHTSLTVGKGATIGANVTIAAGVHLGSYCYVQAGAFVTTDVVDHALVYGSPAKQQGWVSTVGAKLLTFADEDGQKFMKCPDTDEVYTFSKDESGCYDETSIIVHHTKE